MRQAQACQRLAACMQACNATEALSGQVRQTEQSTEKVKRAAAPMCACSFERAAQQVLGGEKAGRRGIPAPSICPRAPHTARMGLQQSRQASALPKPPVEQQEVQPEPCYDGLIPRSLPARQACNAKRVRRLIKAQRLAPCWSPQGAEGEVRVVPPRSWALPVAIAPRCRPLAPAAAGGAPAGRDHRPVKATAPRLPSIAGVPGVHGGLQPAQQHGMLPPRHM